MTTIYAVDSAKYPRHQEVENQRFIISGTDFLIYIIGVSGLVLCQLANGNISGFTNYDELYNAYIQGRSIKVQP